MWLERLDGSPAVHRGLALAPAARRLLEAGLGVRGLLGDRVRRLRRRRLGRPVPEHRPAPPRRPAGPAQGPDRPVVAQLSRGRRSRSGDRLPPGGAALVGPLAQGDRRGDHGRAHAARLDAGVGAARGLLRRAPGPLGRRAELARRARAEEPPARAARGRARSARRSTACSPATGARTAGRRSSPRPAGRGRALALLHLGPARGAARAARLPGGRAHPLRRPPAGPRLRTPLRRRARRRLHPRHPRPAQPHPPRRPRAARRRSTRASATRSACA